MKVTKTRYGYFPCGKAELRKIRKLYGYYHLALQQAANWRRWHAKKAENRVRQSRVTANGRTHLGLILPIPEPRLVPVFTTKEVVTCYFDRSGHYVEGGIQSEKVSVCDMGILALYDAARRPKKYEKNLPEITTTLAEIEQMLTEIRLAGW